jgi:predicted cobalt transporter CbtA
MIHDLIIALVFLAMIIAPAIVSAPDRDEKDSL